jgi:beta-glucanase (GH16 family)
MVALWMIGFEDRPDRSGEICVVEIFGRDVEAGRAGVGMGVHPHHDERIRDDFERVPTDIDVTAAHAYAVAWEPDRLAWYVDERLVRTVHQAIDYPMQLMLGIYGFPEPDAGPDEPFAPLSGVFDVDWVRTWRPGS